MNLLPHTAIARSDFGWMVLRIVLAGLIAAHGWARLIEGGVAPFGAWLTGRGFPFGPGIAIAITAIEIVGSALLLFRRLVLPLTLIYAFIYAMGIVLVHASAGWFVVGLGRNGSEYSVLLIVCLLCVGLQHVRTSSER
jgi:putative oxidoreductase